MLYKKEEELLVIEETEKELEKKIDIDIDNIKPNTIDIVNEFPEVHKRKKKTKGSGSSDKMYFTEETEKYIILYNKEENDLRRNEIYENHIKFAFDKLAENILNTFKFSYFEVSSLDVQKEVVSFLVQNIHKFKEGRGKAFSYFSIVAKHYLILNNNTNYKKFKNQLNIEDQPLELKELVILPRTSEIKKEGREFIELMIKFWETNIPIVFKKEMDKKIAYAIIEVFRSCDTLENFNKKFLYVCIREIADCKTQHITKIINRMKASQIYIMKKYRNFGYIDFNEKINPALF